MVEYLCTIPQIKGKRILLADTYEQAANAIVPYLVDLWQANWYVCGIGIPLYVNLYVNMKERTKLIGRVMFSHIPQCVNGKDHIWEHSAIDGDFQADQCVECGTVRSMQEIILGSKAKYPCYFINKEHAEFFIKEGYNGFTK